MRNGSEKRGCPADDILDGVLNGDGAVTSLREAYVAITGDRELTGKMECCNYLSMHNHLGTSETRFTEAITSATLGNVLGDALHRQILRYMQMNPMLKAWRKIVRVGRIEDFRVHKHIRIGGYGDLPQVGEGNAYAALVSPDQEAYEFALTKRGGTESITMEVIANDDVGAVREIARQLALSAARTLNHFVFDFLKDNPSIYDGSQLFHISRGNLGNAALSEAGLSGSYRAMMKFENAAMNQRNYVKPKFILVPLELEETAFNILQRSSNLDKSWIQTRGLEVLPILDWTDENDWVLAGDPTACETIKVAFLDGNEEPDLIRSDVPSAGMLFSNDKVTYKIRHIYGGAVADWRAFYKNEP